MYRTGKCLQIQRGESGGDEYSYSFSCRSVKPSSLPSAMGPPSCSGSSIGPGFGGSVARKVLFTPDFQAPELG